MNIDKTRFFLLVSAIGASTVIAVAGGGCTVNTTDTGGDAAAPTTTLDGSTTTPDGSLGDSSTEGACLNDTDAGLTCPNAESLDGGVPLKCQASCTGASTYFKGEVAKAVSDCVESTVTASPTTDQCSAASTTCVTSTVGRACTDDTAGAFCTTFLASCSDVTDGGTPTTQADCTQFVSAMSATGRANLQTCVSDGHGCGDCLQAVKGLAGGD